MMREHKNREGKTPRTLFTEQDKSLAIEGKEVDERHGNIMHGCSNSDCHSYV